MSQHKLTPGLVQVFMGDGKGKTTAALGLAYRAIGHELQVCFLQFVQGNTSCGELHTSKRLEDKLEFLQFAPGCPPYPIMRKGFHSCIGCLQCGQNQEFKQRSYEQAAHSFLKQAVQSDTYDVVIIDAIDFALEKKYLTAELVLELIETKGEHVELVITGRSVPTQIIEAADLVSEIKAVKHPINKGIARRKGIDY